MSDAPLLLTAKESCKLCSCGLSLWYEMDAAGEVPQSVRLHSKRLWVREHLVLFTRYGCPHRNSDQWKQILRELPDVHS